MNRNCKNEIKYSDEYIYNSLLLTQQNDNKTSNNSDLLSQPQVSNSNQYTQEQRNYNNQSRNNRNNKVILICIVKIFCSTFIYITQ